MEKGCDAKKGTAVRTFRFSLQKSSPLLDFLSSRFNYLSREQWAAHAAAGYLSVNGVLVRNAATHVLLANDTVQFDPPRSLEPPVNPTFTVLHEDTSIIVVCKSGNLPVAPGGKYFKNTLAILVEEWLTARDGERREIFPVHRLDKETSGVVVLARTPRAANALRVAFEMKSAAGRGGGEERDAEVAKTYDVILVGDMHAAGFTQGLEVPCRWRVGLAAAEPPAQNSSLSSGKASSSPGVPTLDRLRMCCFPEDSGLGKHALSFITPVAAASGLTRARVRLVTGRSHQIRLHCCALGFPVLGDKLYAAAGVAPPCASERSAGEAEVGGATTAARFARQGSVSDELYLKRARGEASVLGPDGIAVARHMLHATVLRFPHPDSGELLNFEAPAAEVFLRELPHLPRELFFPPQESSDAN